MKITLISPYSVLGYIGIRTISACLKKVGHKTQLIFMPKVDFRENPYSTIFMPQKFPPRYSKKSLKILIDLVRDSNLIGISLSTNFFLSAVEITKAIKNELKVPIIWGGIHPTIKPRECLKYADIVCRGEGEEAIVELAEKLEKGENYYNIRNLGFKDKNGKIILNPLRPLIQNLDSIPFQDYDLENEFLILKGDVEKVIEIISKGMWPFSEKTDRGVYRTIFTRGCAFSCSYCCNNTLKRLYHGERFFRKRSVDNVIEELKQIKNKLPFKLESIWFHDDNFFALTLEEIKEFSEKYKRSINLPFGTSGVNPVFVSREKLEYLVSAGFYGLRMGIQTASERIKKLYKRDYCSNSQIENACKIINNFKNKLKIIHYDIITDNPWEKEEDKIKTLMFLSKIPVPYELALFSLVFYPGTELYYLAKKEKIVKKYLTEICQKNYWNIKKDYFNKIFFLLRMYAIYGQKVDFLSMILLTNKFFRKLKLNWVIYFFLLIKIKIFQKISRKKPLLLIQNEYS